MGKTLIVVVILLVVALLIGSSFVGIRNQMVTKRETVNAAWSAVDIALQRRADLIPNIVGTVKGRLTGSALDGIRRPWRWSLGC